MYTHTYAYMHACMHYNYMCTTYDTWGVGLGASSRPVPRGGGETLL